MADTPSPAALLMPLAADAHAAAPKAPAVDRRRFGQIVLVLQGSEASGAYQGGAFQALAGAGIAPDWIIKASIGAINAALNRATVLVQWVWAYLTFRRSTRLITGG